MAARSIASLTIAFGLVAIPVKLYSATVGSERLRFHLLHAKDGSRLRQQYVCLEEEQVVGREEIVKGYEFAKDRYVMFTPQELQVLEEAGSHGVEIAQFVPLAAVDPVYFERTYYLARAAEPRPPQGRAVLTPRAADTREGFRHSDCVGCCLAILSATSVEGAPCLLHACSLFSRPRASPASPARRLSLRPPASRARRRATTRPTRISAG